MITLLYTHIVYSCSIFIVFAVLYFAAVQITIFSLSFSPFSAVIGPYHTLQSYKSNYKNYNLNHIVNSHGDFSQHKTRDSGPCSERKGVLIFKCVLLI